MRARVLALLCLSALAQCGGGAFEVAVDELRDLDGEEAAFVRLLNDYRASMGLPALTATRLLNQVAYDHSLAMGTQGFFSHTAPSGSTPFTRMSAAGYPYGVAENIAAGNADAARTFTQWRNSPGHNTNMLNARARAIGVGRAFVSGSRYRYYWTNIFGSVVDGSANPADSGVVSPPRDAGTPPRDAGTLTPPRDAGTTPRDAGTLAPPRDAGAAALPIGSPCTAGSQCADGFCVPVEGGRMACTRRCADDCGCPSASRCVSASADGSLRVCYAGPNACGAGASDGGGASEDTGVIQGSCATSPGRAGGAGWVLGLALLSRCARRARSRSSPRRRRPCRSSRS